MSESHNDIFVTQRILALRVVLAAKPNFLTDRGLSDFLSAYFLCEALANKLIEYFEKDIPPSTPTTRLNKCQKCGTKIERPVAKRKIGGAFKTLHVGNLKKASTHFSLDFSSVNADALFKSGQGKVGQRTPRQLRNEYAHSLAPKAREEIEERLLEFLELMSLFCEAIECRISVK